MIIDKRKSYNNLVSKTSLLDLTSPQSKKKVKFKDSSHRRYPSESGGGNSHLTSRDDSKKSQQIKSSKKRAILGASIKPNQKNSFIPEQSKTPKHEINIKIIHDPTTSNHAHGLGHESANASGNRNNHKYNIRNNNIINIGNIHITNP